MKSKVFVSLILLSCFILPLNLPASCNIDVVVSELSYFHEKSSENRFAHLARISGDGKKIVFVESESGFDTSLSGWLSGKEGGWSTENSAKIYLYDVESKQASLIYTGLFATSSVEGTTVLQSLESGFSVDINFDGSQVVMAYSKTSFNGARDAITNTLVFSLLDTSTGSVTEFSSIAIPGHSTQTIPLKLSGDGSRLVFVYTPAAAETYTTWGVEYSQDPSNSKLASLAIQTNAQLVVLSDGTGENGTESEILWTLSDEYTQSFDISSDGSRIIFGYPNSGKIMGINSDGSDSHLIASVTSGKAINVAISGDGNTVAYTERGSDDTILYKNNFTGSNQSIILNKSTFASGNLFLDYYGNKLIFNNAVAGPGGSYGYSKSSYYVYTDGSMIISDLKKDLYDVSFDFGRVLTSYYYSAALDLNYLTAGSFYDAETNMLYLSSLYISGDEADNTYLVFMQLTKAAPLTFQVTNAQLTQRANLNAIYYPGDELRVPYLAVGDSCYKISMKIADAASFLFELKDAELLE